MYFLINNNGKFGGKLVEKEIFPYHSQYQEMSLLAIKLPK